MDIDPQELRPLHDPWDRTLLSELVDNMRANGWRGSELLVVKRVDGTYQAWTGSHRIAAAREAGFDRVPCYVIREKAVLKYGADARYGHCTDADRLALVRRLRDERAIEIMWREGRLG